MEPVLDEDDAVLHKLLLETGSEIEETLIFCVTAETHDLLHSKPVVPTSVEEHHLTASRKVRDIPLEIPLGSLAVRWCRGCNGSYDARIEASGDGLDGSTFTGRISPFENDDDSQRLIDYPRLELGEFRLEVAQLRVVLLILHGSLVVSVRPSYV
jgi:hypothetical protein